MLAPWEVSMNDEPLCSQATVTFQGWALQYGWSPFWHHIETWVFPTRSEISWIAYRSLVTSTPVHVNSSYIPKWYNTKGDTSAASTHKWFCGRPTSIPQIWHAACPLHTTLSSSRLQQRIMYYVINIYNQYLQSALPDLESYCQYRNCYLWVQCHLLAVPKKVGC